MQVRIKNSPYYSVAQGAVGKVIARKFRGSTIETWRVLFHGGESRLFHPPGVRVNGEPELEVLSG